MRDLMHNLSVVQVVPPQVLSATNTASAVDLAGYRSVMVVVNTGAIASAGDFTAKLQHSHTTTSGDFVDVAAPDLLGTFPASLAENSVVKVGYVGNRRYLRTVITKNGGTSIAADVVLVRGNGRERPIS